MSKGGREVGKGEVGCEWTERDLDGRKTIADGNKTTLTGHNKSHANRQKWSAISQKNISELKFHSN